jgi:hypothetical protein
MPGDPYDRLLDLCRRERELVAPESLGELAEIQRQRIELIATLPPEAPAQAHEKLAEAQLLVAETIAELLFGMDNARAELAHLNRGRAALAGYAPERHSLLEAKG